MNWIVLTEKYPESNGLVLVTLTDQRKKWVEIVYFNKQLATFFFNPSVKKNTVRINKYSKEHTEKKIEFVTHWADIDYEYVNVKRVNGCQLCGGAPYEIGEFIYDNYTKCGTYCLECDNEVIKSFDSVKANIQPAN